MKICLLMALFIGASLAFPQEFAPRSKGAFLRPPPDDDEVEEDYNEKEKEAIEKEEVDVETEERQGFSAVKVIVNSRSGEEISVDADNLDINGCLVGPGGERVCPHGSYGAGNDFNTFRGNGGSGGVGSNGNAAPIDAKTGVVQNPAVISYLKQLERYKEFERREEEANKKRIG